MSIQLFAALIALLFLANVLFFGGMMLVLEYGIFRFKELITESTTTLEQMFDDHVETTPGMTSPYHN